MSKINFVTEYSFESTRYHGNFCWISVEVLILFIDIVATRESPKLKLCDLTNHTRQVPDRDMPPSRVPRALLSWNIFGHWLADNGSKFLLNFIEVRSKGNCCINWWLIGIIRRPFLHRWIWSTSLHTCPEFLTTDVAVITRTFFMLLLTQWRLKCCNSRKGATRSNCPLSLLPNRFSRHFSL